MALLRRGLRAFQTRLSSDPYKTSMATASALCIVGDFAAQHIERRLLPVRRRENWYNYPRTARMALFGLFSVGPINYLWYARLHRHTQHLPIFRQACAKVFADQILFAPIVISWYYAATSLLMGQTTEQCVEKVKQRLIPSWQLCMSMWIPVQFVNFMMVPPVFQALFVNVGNVAWQTYLSFQNNKKYVVPTLLEKEAEKMGESIGTKSREN